MITFLVVLGFITFIIAGFVGIGIYNLHRSNMKIDELDKKIRDEEDKWGWLDENN